MIPRCAIHHADKIERKQSANRACKLKTSAQTAADSSTSPLGRMHGPHVLSWATLRLSQMTGTKGWVAGLSKALQTAGYAFQPQHLHSIDNGELQSLLRGGRQRIWDDLDICPRTAPSQGARKCTYARWFRKPFWAGTSPLTLPLTHAAMQRLLRFRTGCHGLPKDIGSQSDVPRHQRVCQLCGTGFGDEMHPPGL